MRGYIFQEMGVGEENSGIAEETVLHGNKTSGSNGTAQSKRSTPLFFSMDSGYKSRFMFMQLMGMLGQS